MSHRLVQTQLGATYELVESARLGPGKDDGTEANIFHRFIRWTDAGLEYEADPRQDEKLVSDLVLEEQRQ